MIQACQLYLTLTNNVNHTIQSKGNGFATIYFSAFNFTPNSVVNC